MTLPTKPPAQAMPVRSGLHLDPPEWFERLVRSQLIRTHALGLAYAPAADVLIRGTVPEWVDILWRRGIGWEYAGTGSMERRDAPKHARYLAEVFDDIRAEARDWRAVIIPAVIERFAEVRLRRDFERTTGAKALPESGTITEAEKAAVRRDLHEFTEKLGRDAAAEKAEAERARAERVRNNSVYADMIRETKGS